jgi:hypothetical protein
MSRLGRSSIEMDQGPLVEDPGREFDTDSAGNHLRSQGLLNPFRGARNSRQGDRLIRDDVSPHER